MNIYQFFKQSNQHIDNIQTKCLQGNYRFSPYLENLKSKGKDKKPRVISIPTVRDRIVLLALKELLVKIFPECVPKKLPNTYINEIKNLIYQNLHNNILDIYKSKGTEKAFYRYCNDQYPIL